jgi:hypothetical protein
MKQGEMVRSCSTHGGYEKYVPLFGKPEWNRLLGKPGYENNIRTDVKEIFWEGVDWMHFEGSLASSCECGNEPSCSIKGGEFLD